MSATWSSTNRAECSGRSEPKRQESTPCTAQLATNDAAGRLGTSGVREPEGALARHSEAGDLKISRFSSVQGILTLDRAKGEENG
jgi:hypothetical protein